MTGSSPRDRLPTRLLLLRSGLSWPRPVLLCELLIKHIFKIELLVEYPCKFIKGQIAIEIYPGKEC